MRRLASSQQMVAVPPLGRGGVAKAPGPRRGRSVRYAAVANHYSRDFSERFADAVHRSEEVFRLLANHPAIGAELATNGAGDFVVVWTSRDQDGSDGGVFGQRYGATLFEDGFESGDTSAWSNSVP